MCLWGMTYVFFLQLGGSKCSIAAPTCCRCISLLVSIKRSESVVKIRPSSPLVATATAQATATALFSFVSTDHMIASRGWRTHFLGDISHNQEKNIEQVPLPSFHCMEILLSNMRSTVSTNLSTSPFVFHPLWSRLSTLSVLSKFHFF